MPFEVINEKYKVKHRTRIKISTLCHLGYNWKIPSETQNGNKDWYNLLYKVIIENIKWNTEWNKGKYNLPYEVEIGKYKVKHKKGIKISTLCHLRL